MGFFDRQSPTREQKRTYQREQNLANVQDQKKESWWLDYTGDCHYCASVDGDFVDKKGIVRFQVKVPNTSTGWFDGYRLLENVKMSKGMRRSISWKALVNSSPMHELKMQYVEHGDAEIDGVDWPFYKSYKTYLERPIRSGLNDLFRSGRRRTIFELVKGPDGRDYFTNISVVIAGWTDRTKRSSITHLSLPLPPYCVEAEAEGDGSEHAQELTRPKADKL